jgi:mitochondrial inner membrane protease subunit 1
MSSQIPPKRDRRKPFRTSMKFRVRTPPTPQPPSLRARLQTLPSTLLALLSDLRTRAPSTLASARPLVRHASRLTLLLCSMYASAALVQSYVVSYSGNEGASMLPTIPLHGTKSIWSPWYRCGRGLRVGDIVHARSPVHEGRMVGKRVIGMPGDYVVRDESMSGGVGGVGVNGEGEETRGEPTMVQVPEGHVWLAGDNLAWSRDSRFYGPVPMGLIRAKTLWHVTGFTWEAVWMEQLQKVEEGDQV